MSIEVNLIVFVLVIIVAFGSGYHIGDSRG